MFQRFEDIVAWQEARKLSQSIRVFRDRASAEKDFCWDDQIGRSVLSIMANIAEGNDALTNKEFAVFLGYSKRSTMETASHLYYGLDNGYLSQTEFSNTYKQTRKIGSMLASLIAHLNSAKSGKHRIAKKAQTSALT